VVIETFKISRNFHSFVSGIVTISIEIELAWGVHDLRRFEHLSEDGQIERQYLTRLLDECTQLQLPISFDIVGHLLLAECSGDHVSPHSEDWFATDPGTDKHTDSLYYAPDMADVIRTVPCDHELCTHTFSHALFDEISRNTAEWELQQVQRIHKEVLGEHAVSLVPPRHQTPPYDILSEHGIEILRPAINSQASTRVHRFKQLLAGPIPTSTLQMTDDLVETYCTTNPSLTAASLPSGQRESHISFRYLPVSLRQRLHLNNLKESTKAIARRDEHLHLWCHLYDLSNELQWETVRAYLRWLDSFRERNDLKIATMKELNKIVREDA